MSTIKHIIVFARINLILPFLILFPSKYILSQNINSPVPSDTVRLELDKLFGADQRLVNGDFYYVASSGSIGGHPYFFDEKWKEGNVTIGGIKYNNLLLKFDIASNNIVLKTHILDNSIIQFSLKKEKISEFSMDSAKFIRFPDEDNSKEIIFAQLCAEGSVDYLLVKNKKLVLTNNLFSDFMYEEDYQNYLRYKGQLIKFKNRKTLFNLFPEIKPAMKKYLNQNNLSTGRKDTQNITMLVNFCNSLLSNSK